MSFPSLLSFSALTPWPLSTFLAIYLTPPALASALPPSKRFAVGPVMSSPWEHIVLVVSSFWKVFFAVAVYHYMPLDLSAAAVFAPDWMISIILRNVAITWFTGILWDWLHLSNYSPLYATLQHVKFSSTPTRKGQIPHDALWATASAFIAAAWEIIITHGWAVGRLPLHTTVEAWWLHVPTLLLLVTLPYVQIVHFYFIHRFMHNWFPRQGRNGGMWLFPDVGAFLYKHVHSLHHLSRDPTAFSGISMHPMESAIFFTTMPLYALLGAHPIVVMHAQIYNIVVAMIGHESFGAPSTGGHDHWIHHQLIDCNFGGTFVPLDYLFGSFARDEDDFNAKMGAKGKDK
jgi:lathosterol oxidase